MAIGYLEPYIFFFATIISAERNLLGPKSKGSGPLHANQPRLGG